MISDLDTAVTEEGATTPSSFLFGWDLGDQMPSKRKSQTTVYGENKAEHQPTKAHNRDGGPASPSIPKMIPVTANYANHDPYSRQGDQNAYHSNRSRDEHHPITSPKKP